MNLAAPIYFVLAHFWIAGPIAPDPQKSVPIQVSTYVAHPHFEDIEECKELGQLLTEADKEDASSLITEGQKLLLNHYVCLPIFIDKDHQT